MNRIFRSWTARFRESDEEWLLVDQRGEYQYRTPDSLYVHPWASFKTREAAITYLEERVAPVDRDHFRLYRREAADGD